MYCDFMSGLKGWHQRTYYVETRQRGMLQRRKATMLLVTIVAFPMHKSWIRCNLVTVIIINI